MRHLPFPAMRDDSLDRAARQILRILEAEEARKRGSSQRGTGMPVNAGRRARPEEIESDRNSLDQEWAQVIPWLLPRPIPIPLPIPRPMPVPPLIDPIPPGPLPIPDARRGRRKRQECIDNYVKCQLHRWHTSPGWRCDDCTRYCIAQGKWPYEHCSPMIADAEQGSSRHGSCGGEGCQGRSGAGRAPGPSYRS